MNFLERKETALKLLEEEGSLSVLQLVEVLQSSEATVRRDLIRWEQEGVLKRYWGGAKKIETPESLRKLNLQTQSVQKAYTEIGRFAADQVKDNELIFIGSGTTTLAMIPFLDGKKVHVITNGIPQLEALHKKGIQALLLCGFFKEYSRSVVGKETLDMLRGYHFDRAFLGANGVDDEFNMLSADEYEDTIKKICVEQSRKAYLLINRDKFHRKAFYTIPRERAARVMLITDSPEIPSESWRRFGSVYTGYLGKLGQNMIEK